MYGFTGQLLCWLCNSGSIYKKTSPSKNQMIPRTPNLFSNRLNVNKSYRLNHDTIQEFEIVMIKIDNSISEESHNYE